MTKMKLVSIFSFITAIAYIFNPSTVLASTTLWNDNGTNIFTNVKVGVGTTNPLFPLHVVGSSGSYTVNIVSSGKYVRIGALSASYAFFDTDTTNGFYFYDPVRAGNGNALFNISSGNSFINAGNFGLGTTAPTQKLEVNGNVQISGTNSLIMGNSNFGLQQQNYGDLGNYLGFKSQAGFAFTMTYNNSVPLMISSSGNMGVGTTGTRDRLTVAGDGSVSDGYHNVASFTKSLTNGVYLGYKANGTTATAGLVSTDNNLPLVFGASNGTDRMTIQNDGVVNINGGVKLAPISGQATKPGCASSSRGTMWFTSGVGASGPTAKDTLEVCAQDASGTSSWRTIY